MSRFHIHDDLSAPEGSLPILKAALAGAGQLPNFLGVISGSPAVLRGYTRFRSELRHGTLSLQTQERIALAVAEHYGSKPGQDLHFRTARQAGIGVDEVAAAKQWTSSDEREAMLLRYLQPVVTQHTAPPAHLHEECREIGWDDEQLLEAVATAAIEQFSAMVNLAGDVPLDGSHEASRQLRAA
jgi:alkylhydroperoxidase family enzyme